MTNGAVGVNRKDDAQGGISMETMISVIVAVYNVENYLERCVKSILDQSYENIEILLIDDGSTDSSGTICDEFSKINQNVKVLHKENGGLSSARNAGLDHAQGQWISFIDSDDYVHPDMLRTLLSNAIMQNTKAAVCGLAKVNEKGIMIESYLPRPQVLEREALHRYFFEEGKGTEYMCNKLFHKKLLQDIRFPIGKLYEDTFVLPEILEESKKAVFIDFIGYFYVQREKTISRDINMERQIDGLEAKQSKLSFMEKHYPLLVPKASCEIMEACCWLLYKTYQTKGTDYDNNWKKILETFHKENKRAEKNGFKICAAGMLVTLSPCLFCKLYHIYDSWKTNQFHLQNTL